MKHSMLYLHNSNRNMVVLIVLSVGVCLLLELHDSSCHSGFSTHAHCEFLPCFLEGGSEHYQVNLL